MSTALITGFTAKGERVSTLTVLLWWQYGSTFYAVHSGISVCISTFTLLYTPCVAAMAAVKRELEVREPAGVALMQCDRMDSCVYRSIPIFMMAGIG